MKVLIIGSGGREQAIAWQIAKSAQVEEIFLAPGNAGSWSKCTNLPEVGVSDFVAISETILREQIDLVIVGPEVPLVGGLVDFLQQKEEHKALHILGPTQAAAMLEGSKDFAKAFMQRHGIPTAKYLTCNAETIDAGRAFIQNELKPPYVLKADGLAAGKGVLIVDEETEALQALDDLLSGSLGEAGSNVVLEEYLTGIECSVFVLTDGKSFTLLPVAKDYKRIGEGDTGPNTGGMGAVSPVPFADDTFMDRVVERVIRPTIRGLIEEGIDYRGFIFFGLMNCDGNPYVIEYNCRLGDPETEAIMPRIESDLTPYFLALKEQGLAELPPLQFSSEVAVTVIATSAGYPGTYEKGFAIKGLDVEAPAHIFHAGTAINSMGKVVTNGGRVLAITATATTQAEAMKGAYDRLSHLHFDGIYYRKDIGQDL